MTTWKYTGYDKTATGKLPATERWREYASYLFGFSNLGTFVDRNMVGKTPPQKSVHATGRAMDLGLKDPRKLFDAATWLGQEAIARKLFIEEIHNYSDGTYGRGWRCSRSPHWQVWTAQNNGGSAGGLWLHIELQPGLTVARVDKVWKDLFPS